MAVILTLDSSIIIAALRNEEEYHNDCLRVLEKVKITEYIAVEPYTVLVEVVAAIRRRTGNEFLAERIRNDLLSIGSIYFFDLDLDRAMEASDIAKRTGMRGMDAIVVQIAREFNSILLSLDNEMIKKAEGFVQTNTITGVK